MLGFEVTVGARAALAGNPSDGFDGAVFSTMVPGLGATARFASSSVPEIDLVAATKRRFGQDLSRTIEEGIEVETNIPRSVGLAGSSAIVIATLRLCARIAGLDLAPMRVAELAYAVEREDLGIAGGWQDQLIQAHGGTALMEFAEPRTVIPMTPTSRREIPLYLAYREDTAEASGERHAALQERRAAPDVTSRMARLAQLARQAAEASQSGDVHALKEAINATFDERARLMELNPEHEAMIEAARAGGACANFAGSGGAVVGILPKNGGEFLDFMTNRGYTTVTWELT